MQVTLIPSTDKPWDGIEVYSYELAKRLSKRNIKVIGIRVGIKDDVKYVNQNFKLITAGTPNYTKGLGYYYRVFRAITKNYREINSSEIIHAIGGYYSAIEFIPFKGRKIVTIIGASSLREKKKSKRIIRTIYSSLIYKFAKKYIVPNEFIYKEVKEHYHVNNLEIIPLGVDIEGLTVSERKDVLKEKLGFEPDDIVILYLGQLVHGKRLPELLTAFKKVSEKISNAKLVLVAWGYLKDQLMELATSLNIKDRVIFKKPVPYCERKYVYGAADVLTMIGDSFGDGGVSSAVLDGLGSGLPIIVARGSPNILVVKDGFNGFVVNPSNPEEIALAIMKAVENREYLGKNSKYIAKELDWDLIAEKILKVYKEIY
ncbi:glycosyltransferase family 4 protein [Stygiolobus caldivivus]|uniref:Glycosyl transferase n=1 Tax=Stygiolobus caldivivus TaxID=2824673 RepID=A0A8D5U4D1_9CREN|nr:glycosyltransferase family 4 protein [Stygiolobus caldivivus]BCU69049.1 glycosyl transferase [Stygiolobus caldivivus]